MPTAETAWTEAEAGCGQAGWGPWRSTGKLAKIQEPSGVLELWLMSCCGILLFLPIPHTLLCEDASVVGWLVLSLPGSLLDCPVHPAGTGPAQRKGPRPVHL